jgi:aromatic-L-amino-acid decarboxylase
MKRAPRVTPVGDMDPALFHDAAVSMAAWIQDYLNTPAHWPVLPRVRPGDVRAALPLDAPPDGESMAQMLDDFERILMPAMTHWNHPGFLAYFASSGPLAKTSLAPLRLRGGP